MATAQFGSCEVSLLPSLPVLPLFQVCVFDLSGSFPPPAIDPGPCQNKSCEGKKRHLASVMWSGQWEVSRHDNNHANPCLCDWEDRNLEAMGATWL